ncbi:MAG: 50S ribosomal protein L20 [Candidatus Brocadiae bacterium]|nr:50S ribosomal protein L20 [Candidatus Brocadiia bacterium]
MPRVTCAVARHKRIKRVLKNAKGYRGGRRRYRQARETYHRALRFAFAGRKRRKRDFRQLWITRINSALAVYGVSYSQFMGALNHMKVILNRKTLSEMAINDPNSFAKLVEQVKPNLPGKKK